MLSVEQLRKIDPELRDITDENLEKIRETFYSISQLAFETFNKNYVSKNPIGVLSNNNSSYRI